jgi:hypothetical protein
MLVEAANILRRAERSGALSAEVAALAHADLLALRVGLFPFGPFAARVWELREDLTACGEAGGCVVPGGATATGSRVACRRPRRRNSVSAS